MNRRWKTALVGATVMAMMLSGCVEDEASVVMFGSLIGDGTVAETDDGESLAQCEFNAEMEDVDVQTSGFVNLSDLATAGQPLVGEVESTPDRYDFQAVFENRLFDSRSVGAVSGGEGGGFENIELDKNDIIINRATVEFTPENNSLGTADGATSFAMEAERLVSMLVLSGGGVSTMGVPVINNAGEREAIENFLSGDLGLAADQTVTLIVDIQLHGETLGGNEVESNRVEYPIDFCLDCGFRTQSLCAQG